MCTTLCIHELKLIMGAYEYRSLVKSLDKCRLSALVKGASSALPYTNGVSGKSW